MLRAIRTNEAANPIATKKRKLGDGGEQCVGESVGPALPSAESEKVQGNASFSGYNENASPYSSVPRLHPDGRSEVSRSSYYTELSGFFNGDFADSNGSRRSERPKFYSITYVGEFGNELLDAESGIVDEDADDLDGDDDERERKLIEGVALDLSGKCKRDEDKGYVVSNLALSLAFYIHDDNYPFWIAKLLVDEGVKRGVTCELFQHLSWEVLSEIRKKMVMVDDDPESVGSSPRSSPVIVIPSEKSEQIIQMQKEMRMSALIRKILLDAKNEDTSTPHQENEGHPDVSCYETKENNDPEAFLREEQQDAKAFFEACEEDAHVSSPSPW